MTEEEKERKPKASWKNVCFSVLIMLVWVGATIIALQYIIGYILIWILGAEKLSQPVWLAIYSTLVYTSSLLLVIFVPKGLAAKRASKNKNTKVVTKGSSDREELGLRGLPTWTDIGLAPAGFIVYWLIASGLMAVFEKFPWFNAEEVQNIGFSAYIFGFDRIVAFITLVVVAPIAEEIIFRGWLYGKMRGKLNEKVSDGVSMVISTFLVSLLFGIVHGQWNVGVDVFVMSLVLCGMREVTGTVYSGVLLHMLKNGVAFYHMLFMGGM